MENKKDWIALFMVVKGGFADEIMEIAIEAGLPAATILNARSERADHQHILGISVDKEKEFIVSITDEETAKRVMAVVIEESDAKQLGNTFCFTMPVENVVGLVADKE